MNVFGQPFFDVLCGLVSCQSLAADELAHD